jgi:hypothetical protein
MRNNGTGIIIYQALLVPSKTKIESLMGKEENAMLSVWKQSEDQNNKKFCRQIVKIQVVKK